MDPHRRIPVMEHRPLRIRVRAIVLRIHDPERGDDAHDASPEYGAMVEMV